MEGIQHEEEEEIDMSYEEFLIYSARLGEIEDVKAMIDEKVDLNTTKDPSGNTALRKNPFLMTLVDMAAANGHYEVAKLLLQSGALTSVVNNSNNTPLRKRSFMMEDRLGCTQWKRYPGGAAS